MELIMYTFKIDVGHILHKYSGVYNNILQAKITYFYQRKRIRE